MIAQGWYCRVSKLHQLESFCLNRNPNLKRVSFKRLVNYRTRHSFSKHLLINCPLLPMPPTCYSLIWNEIFKGILASIFCKLKLRVHLSMCGSLHSSYASAVLCGLSTLKKLSNPCLQRNVWRDSHLSHGLHLQSRFRPPRGWVLLSYPPWDVHSDLRENLFKDKKKIRLIVLQVMERFLR